MIEEAKDGEWVTFAQVVGGHAWNIKMRVASDNIGLWDRLKLAWGVVFKRSNLPWSIEVDHIYVSQEKEA